MASSIDIIYSFRHEEILIVLENPFLLRLRLVNNHALLGRNQGSMMAEEICHAVGWIVVRVLCINLKSVRLGS